MNRADFTLDDAIAELRQSPQFLAWGKVTLDVLAESHASKDERHYTPQELADMWKVSVDVIRRAFRDEPGVLKIGEKSPKHKQQYLTLRIPESVVDRVHTRLSA
jgi:hypothetical protein